MINLHRLEGFYWVARTGGYARAARAFPYPITPPAIHQQVTKVQAEVGAPLLQRVAKDQMRLTPAGRHLYEFISPYFEGLPALVRALRASDYGGEIHVQASSLLLQDLLPSWIRRIREKAPEARVHLHELSGLADLSLLRSGQTDLVVSYLPEQPEDLTAVPVGTLHAVVVVPHGHRLASRDQVSLRALERETFIGYTPGTLAHRIQTEALASQGVAPARTLTADTAQTILAFVEAGLGVSALATLDAEGPRRRGVHALRVVRPRFDLPVVAAIRRRGPPHPLLKVALETAPKP